MILVIGAMEQEISVFKDMIEGVEELNISGVNCFMGKFAGKDVLLMLSGIGKINAAVNTTIMFENFKITHVINIGTAGGFGKDLAFGDVVVSDRVVCHDVDITGFGREMGEIPDQPIYFESDQSLIDLIINIKDDIENNIHIGLIATGDQFIHSVDKMDSTLNHFPEILACEMEAYAVSRVCHKYQTPIIVVRSISDLVFLENSYDFNEYLEVASKNSTTMLTHLIKEIEV